MQLLLFVLLFVKITFGENVVRIKDTNEFLEFSNNVNKGTNYYGTTVLLDCDLSLSGKTLEPIGNSSTSTNYFDGVFDGQGHIISNLRINSTSRYAGLFGLSNGLTIRNVVLDSSCSITSTYSGYTNVWVGGIIGYCYARSRECNIENSVNMADVTFSGDICRGYCYTLYLGGIAGLLFSTSYDISVKNCANYGSVTHSGTRYNSYIGGIVGFSSGSSSYKYIQNCLNYGTITHNGTTSFLGIGEIAGYTYHTYIENCLSAGKISIQTTASSINYIGSIVGSVDSNVCINYCYYTNDVNVNKINGAGTPSTLGTPDTPTDVNLDLVSSLNSNATSCNWSKWLLNTNSATVTFKMSDNKEVSFSSQIILIPKPVKEGKNFLFWCKDAECTEVFGTESVSGTTTLYASWANNTVSFDFGNRTTVNKTFTYNSEIIYPDVKKEGYTLSWDNYHELMPSRDITVTARWTPNNYTVTFDFDNGTTVNEIFTYNTSIEYPQNDDMKREGYIFSGWDKSDIVHMPAQNITITTQWTANIYTVTFDANEGNNLSVTSMTVTYNTSYGTLPENVTRTRYTFAGWFTGREDGDKVESGDKVKIPDNHTLYVHWTANNYTITFNFNNGVEEEVKVFEYNASVVYPADPLREGYIFSGWDKSGIVQMPAQNITVNALWKANNYTVTFDANGGSNLSVTSMIVTFNSLYGPLPTPTKEGYMFLGWFTGNNMSVKSETIVRIADNHALHAQWEKTTSQVEIVFNTKDLSREDVEELVKKYTDANFTITEFEEESGEIKVIIKFTNNEEAARFARNANELSRDNDDNLIKRIGFVSDNDASFSSLLYPTLFLTTVL